MPRDTERPSDPERPRYYTPPEVAKEWWKCSPDRVVDLIKSGKLRAFTLSPPGCKRPHWKIPEEAILEFELANQPKPPTPKPRRRRALPPTIDYFPD